MARILAIDYGKKQVGIAVTDPGQIICTPLITIPKKNLLSFLVEYEKKEKLECIVLGLPKHTYNKIGDIEQGIQVYIVRINEALPHVPIKRVDERFTSMIALRALNEMGYKKKKAKEQGMIDKISASLILQTYLELKQLNH